MSGGKNDVVIWPASQGPILQISETLEDLLFIVVLLFMDSVAT